MRQAGFLAAAAIYALDNNVNRLAEDHKKAQQIGEVLENCSFVKKVETIETNIIIFYVNDTIDPMIFINKMEEKGILLISMGEGKIRIVTHLDFSNEMLEKLLNELKCF
jgi:threonine aldolase